MKAFHQAPVVGHFFPSSGKPCIFFRSGPYHYSFSHLHQLVASKDTNKKHKRVVVNSPSEMSSPKSTYGICKDSYSGSPMNMGLMSAGGDEILCALSKIEQDILQGKFEWKDSQDVHTNIMEALVNLVGEKAMDLTPSNKSDRCLFILKSWCMDSVESIVTRIKPIQVALLSLAIRNKGLVLTGNQNAEDNATLESIILPIVKALYFAASNLRSYHRYLSCTVRGHPLVDAYNDRCQIEFIGFKINYGVREILMHLVKTFVSWRNLPFFMPNDEVIMYDTFLEKFHPKGRAYCGFSALRNCLNTVTYRENDYFDIEEARFYLFSGVENVLEMLELCIKFSEGVAFQESSRTGCSDAMSLARFLRSKGLCLETSYDVVCRCLKKQLQPGELTPQALQKIGFPCDSLEEILEARSLLLGKQIALDEEGSFAELLSWCSEIELEPGSF